jgi:hypothetical protein
MMLVLTHATHRAMLSSAVLSAQAVSMSLAMATGTCIASSEMCAVQAVKSPNVPVRCASRTLSSHSNALSAPTSS